MLDRNTSPQALNPLHILLTYSFSMVDEPDIIRQWNLLVHLFYGVKESRNTFIVCGMNTEWPFLQGQQANNGFEVCFQGWRQFGTRVEEILEISGITEQPFASTSGIIVDLIDFVGSMRAYIGHPHPLRKILQFGAFLLCIQEIRKADSDHAQFI